MATDSKGPFDFEALSRQYWGAWGDALRAAQPAPATPDWASALDWWGQLAHGGRAQANDAVERFNAQARSWFGMMQQVAARFAGQDASAGDIAAEWKRALGAAGENPFPEMFRAMRGQGQQGLEQWIEDASPMLEAWRREGSAWLGLPAFGIGREHQERWQRLGQAQLDYQQREAAYNALMFKAVQRAYELFESKLAEREAPGRQLSSARALFDLWIDAAEEAYAGIALSPEFRETYGAMVNAQMRLRQGVQREVEQMGAQFGMPTRTEVDAAHRKIAELERALRRMRDAQSAATATTPTPPRAPVREAAASPAPATRPAARTPPAKPSTASLKVAGDPLLGPRPATRAAPAANKKKARKPGKERRP